jgi:pyrroloquinoline-quinone synthase
VDAVTRIDAAARRWNVLEHPFYLRWSAGELSAAELANYASQYRHAVVALADAAAAAGNDEHAREERDHVALWDEFAAACGAPDAAAANADTRTCAGAWRAGEDRLEHVAVLYAVESRQPEIACTKLEGLLAHYGFSEGPATEYFSVHAERDVAHAAASRAELEVASDADAGRLAARAEAALRGNWQLLDGVTA